MRCFPCIILLLCGLLAGPAPVHALEVEIEITGVDGEIRDNVLATLSLQRYRNMPELNETMLRRLYRRARGEIRQALQPFGHYTPSIDAELVPHDTGWRARFDITPGEPVRFGDIDIQLDGAGADAPALAAIRDQPGLRSGERLRHARYEQARQRLQRAANDLGYLDARFTRRELRVSVERGTADVVLHLDTGPRYLFGPVTFDQDVLEESFIRRYVQIEPGDPYNHRDLLALQYALGDSEYFSAVEIESRREDAVDLRVPVSVRLEPRPRHRYTAGIGYGTDTGPRGIAGWENRRVNRRGHRLASELRVSRIMQSINARYVIPLDNPVHERLVVGLGHNVEELGDIRTRRSQAVVAHTSMQGEWLHTLSGRVLRERDEIGDETLRSTQLIPETEWLRTHSAGGLRPRKAYRLTLNAQGSGPALGAPANFVRLRTRGRLILPVGENDRLLLRGELGTLVTDDALALPASQRFFAGGDASVRGYSYQRLGPQDEAGRVVGGKHLAVASVEYERWLTGNWGIAAFVDAGNAFNDEFELATGAGIGARWLSPVGVVAIDLAHPFDDPDGRSVRLHISFGVAL